MTRMKPGVFSWEDVLAQRFQSNKPPPLLRSQSIQAPQAQPQSRLLARLSPELRLMIWEYVLGGQRIHIIQCSQQRLGHVVCPSPLHKGTETSSKHHARRNSDQFCDICHGTGIPQPAKEGDLARSRNKVMLLGLALTCRQIYHESIAMLYTLPTFEFSNPWSLPYLFPTIPLEHWRSIRAVELRWSFPGHWLPSKDSVRAVYVSAGRAQWQETCGALVQINALRSFVLVLNSTWFSEGAGKLVGFLEPLTGLVVRPVSRRWNWDGDRATSTSSRSRMDGSRGGYRFDELAGSSSSDEDSCGSLSSQGSFSETFASRSISGYSTSPTMDCMGRWELRLQGQSYYPHELDKIGDDLRQRGIDCWISAV